MPKSKIWRTRQTSTDLSEKPLPAMFYTLCYRQFFYCFKSAVKMAKKHKKSEIAGVVATFRRYLITRSLFDFGSALTKPKWDRPKIRRNSLDKNWTTLNSKNSADKHQWQVRLIPLGLSKTMGKSAIISEKIENKLAVTFCVWNVAYKNTIIFRLAISQIFDLEQNFQYRLPNQRFGVPGKNAQTFRYNTEQLCFIHFVAYRFFYFFPRSVFHVRVDFDLSRILAFTIYISRIKLKSDVGVPCDRVKSDVVIACARVKSEVAF